MSFEKALDNYVTAINTLIEDEESRESRYFATRISYAGRKTKYVRLVKTSYDVETGEEQSSKSVYGFVERDTGNVYRAAGWKAAAKNHVRGNIYDLENALAWTGRYGIAYIEGTGTGASFEGEVKYTDRWNVTPLAVAKIKALSNKDA